MVWSSLGNNYSLPCMYSTSVIKSINVMFFMKKCIEVKWKAVLLSLHRLTTKGMTINKMSENILKMYVENELVVHNLILPDSFMNGDLIPYCSRSMIAWHNRQSVHEVVL